MKEEKKKCGRYQRTLPHEKKQRARNSCCCWKEVTSFQQQNVVQNVLQGIVVAGGGPSSASLAPSIRRANALRTSIVYKHCCVAFRILLGPKWTRNTHDSTVAVTWVANCGRNLLKSYLSLKVRSGRSSVSVGMMSLNVMRLWMTGPLWWVETVPQQGLMISSRRSDQSLVVVVVRSCVQLWMMSMPTCLPQKFVRHWTRVPGKSWIKCVLPMWRRTCGTSLKQNCMWIRDLPSRVCLLSDLRPPWPENRSPQALPGDATLSRYTHPCLLLWEASHAATLFEAAQCCRRGVSRGRWSVQMQC